MPLHVALYFGREKKRERTRFIEEGTRAPMTLDESGELSPRWQVIAWRAARALATDVTDVTEAPARRKAGACGDRCRRDTARIRRGCPASRVGGSPALLPQPLT